MCNFVPIRQHVCTGVFCGSLCRGQRRTCVWTLSLQLSVMCRPSQCAVCRLSIWILQAGKQLRGNLFREVQRAHRRTKRFLIFRWRTSQTKLISSLLVSHFGNTTTMACEQCDPSCSQCGGRGNRNCLSCREDYVYLGRGGQCLRSCPSSFYQHSRSKTCHQCHPTCKTCSGKGSLSWLISDVLLFFVWGTVFWKYFLLIEHE